MAENRCKKVRKSLIIGFADFDFRRNIEVSCYEQKTFRSLCSYMTRSRKSIETMINLINISYSAMKILPYKDEAFSNYKNACTQAVRFEISRRINEQVIFAVFVKNVETKIKTNAVMKALKMALSLVGYHG